MLVSSMTSSARNKPTLKPELTSWLTSLVPQGLYDSYPEYNQGQIPYGAFGERRERGPCIRKEYRSLNITERNRFIFALSEMKRRTVNGTSWYDTLASLYNQNLSPGAHFGSARLPWHREYLFRFEQALTLIDSRACLPYWDSTLDSDLAFPYDAAQWSPREWGYGEGKVGGVFDNWRPHANCGSHLLRELGITTFKRPYLRADVDYILSRSQFAELDWDKDNRIESDVFRIHGFVGGTMARLDCSPADPVFWMHAAFADLLWEEFRMTKQVTDPHTEYPRETSSNAHLPSAPMAPFAVNNFPNNMYGLGEHYTRDFYTYPSRGPRHCFNSLGCGHLEYCDLRVEACRIRIKKYGDCTGVLYHDACMCYDRDTPVCFQNSCQCVTP